MRSLCAVGIFLFSIHSHALVIGNKTVRAGVTGGLPNLIAADLALVKFKPFVLGLTFGAFPVQALIGSRVSLNTIPLSITSANTYTMSPSATYFLNGLEVYFNFYPMSESGLFIRASYANLAFQANGSGTLNNVTAGTSLSNAISVVANVSQPMVSGKVGYDFFLSDQMSFTVGAGIAYLLTATNSITTGGTASAASVVAPDADAAFTSAKNNMTNSFNSAIAELNALSRIIPSAFVTLAYLF